MFNTLTLCNHTFISKSTLLIPSLCIKQMSLRTNEIKQNSLIQFQYVLKYYLDSVFNLSAQDFAKQLLKLIHRNVTVVMETFKHSYA